MVGWYPSVLIWLYIRVWIMYDIKLLWYVWLVDNYYQARISERDIRQDITGLYMLISVLGCSCGITGLYN